MEIKELADIVTARLDKLEGKVDELKDRWAAMNAALARHEQLPKRVEQAEEDIAALKDHASKVKGAVALIGLLAMVGELVHYYVMG